MYTKYWLHHNDNNNDDKTWTEIQYSCIISVHLIEFANIRHMKMFSQL